MGDGLFAHPLAQRVLEFGLLDEYEDIQKLLKAITKARSTAVQGLFVPSTRMLLCLFRAMRKLAPVRPT